MEHDPAQNTEESPTALAGLGDGNSSIYPGYSAFSQTSPANVLGTKLVEGALLSQTHS